MSVNNLLKTVHIIAIKTDLLETIEIFLTSDPYLNDLKCCTEDTRLKQSMHYQPTIFTSISITNILVHYNHTPIIASSDICLNCWCRCVFNNTFMTPWNNYRIIWQVCDWSFWKVYNNISHKLTTGGMEQWWTRNNKSEENWRRKYKSNTLAVWWELFVKNIW